MRATSDAPVLTYILIGINVAVALGALLGGASATTGGIGGSTLLQEGSVSRFTIGDGEYYRLLTAGFLHAGFFHLLFNMLVALHPGLAAGAGRRAAPLRADLLRVAPGRLVRRAARWSQPPPPWAPPARSSA